MYKGVFPFRHLYWLHKFNLYEIMRRKWAENVILLGTFWECHWEPLEEIQWEHFEKITKSNHVINTPKIEN